MHDWREKLQWSHARLSVETILGIEQQPRLNDASMEPRSIERGNFSCQVEAQADERCFNGATLD